MRNHGLVYVFGGSGFVGTAVRDALNGAGFRAVPLRAPRYLISPREAQDLHRLADRSEAAGLSLSRQLSDLPRPDFVINCAGKSDAEKTADHEMWGANTLLPATLYNWAKTIAVPFIHVSSSAVQGTRRTLDSEPVYAPETPYGTTKAAAELGLMAMHKPALAPLLIYRPPGVHWHGRRTTRTIARFAASPFSVTAKTPRPTPQALLPNVADAVRFLVAQRGHWPREIVHHPSEGLDTHRLLRDLGGRQPHLLPDLLAASLLRLADWPGRADARVQAYASRARILLFGQRQANSYLSSEGWTPPVDLTSWKSLRGEL